MIVLDTTVLVYAVGGDHPLAYPCRRLISAIGDGRVQASTTPEAIQEFIHVRARRRSRSDASSLGRAYAELLAPLLVVDGRALSAGLRLFERSRKLGAFDAILAATAIAADAEAVVSGDGAFAEVSGISWWSPTGPEIDRLLSDRAGTDEGRA